MSYTTSVFAGSKVDFDTCSPMNYNLLFLHEHGGYGSSLVELQFTCS